MAIPNCVLLIDFWCNFETDQRCLDCNRRFALFYKDKDIYKCECGAVTDADSVTEMETQLEAEAS